MQSQYYYDDCPSCPSDLPPAGQPLAAEGSIYNYDRRPARDTAWGVMYVVYLAACMGGGVYAFQNRNADFDKFHADYLMDGTHCGNTGSLEYSASASPTSADSDDIHLDVHYWKRALVWVGISLGSSVVLGLVMLHLLTRYARFFMKVAIVMSVGSMLGSAVAVYQVQPVLCFVYLFLAALSAFVFWLWRVQIELVSKLIAVSAAGIKENPALISVAVVLKFVLVVVLAPLALGLVFAQQNGHLAANGTPTASGVCVQTDATSGLTIDVPCCAFKTATWVPVYSVVAALGLLWSVMLAFEFRIFSISGSIAQWYFLPAGGSTAGTTRRALAHAFGPSFGTLCFGSLVLTWVEIVRAAARRAEERSGNILTCLLACLAQCLMTILEQITKFGTIMAAITGQAFCQAAGSATDVLTRNFLSSYAVWWLPGFMLRTLAFSIAVLFGTCVGGAVYLEESARRGASPGPEAVLTGVLAAAIVGVVVSFFVSLVIDVVDVVYICYALDKDQQQITRPAVHEVYVLIPQPAPKSIGNTVQNPSGDIAYAAPPADPYGPSSQAPQAPHMYQQPQTAMYQQQPHTFQPPPMYQAQPPVYQQQQYQS